LMDAVKEPVAATRKHDVLQTMQEMVIVGVAAYLDEFVNCMVGLACAHQERDFATS
jgi:hypothetical protein